MAKRPRVGVIGSAVFAPRSSGNTSREEALHAVTHAALRDAGISIEDIDGIVVASCDQLDGRGMASGSVGGVGRDILVDAIERRACIRTGRAARALRPLQHPAAVADARMCRIGGGTAEVMKQIIGNALLPNVRKAN